MEYSKTEFEDCVPAARHKDDSVRLWGLHALTPSTNVIRLLLVWCASQRVRWVRLS